MTIIIRRPWTQQPQYAVGINWSSPLSRGLCFLVNYADASLRNLVTGELPALSSNIVRTASQKGKAAYTSAQPNLASWTGTMSTSTRDGLGALTMLSFSAPPSEASISALLSQSDGDGQPQTYLLANTNTGYGASAGTISFGGLSGIYASIGSVVDGRWRAYLCTRNAARNSSTINIDGVDVLADTSDFGDAWASASTSRFYASGINGYTGWTRSHPHVLQAAWNRELSAAERASIGRNPWQLFEPRQIIIPTPTAAGAAPTLSALSAINITATSAQPRMTYTF